MVSCRFAPSPTGLLHVGGARTALFNWAFARHAGGQFRLRIEDTDKARSTKENEESIIDALKWLDIEPDGEIVRQSARSDLYAKEAQRLMEEGRAYRCYASPQELEELRQAQEARGQKPMYDRRWRDRTDHPQGKEHCLRFATPLEGACVIDDLVRGEVTVANSELDDPVIIRADGSATYNFAAATDDGEMGITHVIRGEDHLTNTIRQVHIHEALGNDIPKFAHLAMILGRKVGDDGIEVNDELGEPVYEKMSKRNMAADMDHYRKEGFLPEAMVNYLAQLGWTQPGAEVYGPVDLTREFDITKVNNSAARFDIERLRWINWQHMRLAQLERLGDIAGLDAPSRAIEIAREKAHTIKELREELQWLSEPGMPTDPTLAGHLVDDNRQAFLDLCSSISNLDSIDGAAVKELIKGSCKKNGLKFPKLGMPLRVALTGREQSPDIGEVVDILGRDECKKRLASVVEAVGQAKAS